MANADDQTQSVIRIVDDGSGSPTIVRNADFDLLPQEQPLDDEREWVSIEE